MQSLTLMAERRATRCGMRGKEDFVMKKATLSTERIRFGRPCLNPEKARSNRLVTFVTNSELTNLELIADEKGMSLSAVVHKILSGYLKDT